MKHLLLLTAALALLTLGSGRAMAQAEEHPPAGPATGHGPAEDHRAAPAGQDGGGHPSAGSHAAGAAHGEAGPVPPKTPQRWPGVMVVLVLATFFAAAVIGPIVRSQAPPEMPPTHSHDEPPGASHHHGHTGTINPVPEDVARLEQPHDRDRGHRH